MANEEYTGGGKVLRTTPHDPPAIKNPNPNPNNTSKLGFLLRLVYAVTCAFWKRNTGTNEEQRNTGASKPKGWNLTNISAAEISDLETMLKRKTFTSEEPKKVSETYKIDINDGQCRSNFATLKLKYKKENAKMEGSGMMGGMGGYYGIVRVSQRLMRMKRRTSRRRMRMRRLMRKGLSCWRNRFRIVARFMRRLRGGKGSRSWRWRRWILQGVGAAKKEILERAQAEIAKIREEDGEDANSVENLSG
nr:hypothetical protein [Tanacetum cinerariifolium]